MILGTEASLTVGYLQAGSSDVTSLTDLAVTNRFNEEVSGWMNFPLIHGAAPRHEGTDDSFLFVDVS